MTRYEKFPEMLGHSSSLLLLALKPYMGFGLLHQIIPEFPIFKELDPISQF
jgi:hypothetical protein